MRGDSQMAEDGKLDRFLDVKTVEKSMLNIYLNNISEDSAPYGIRNIFDRWGRRKDV